MLRGAFKERKWDICWFRIVLVGKANEVGAGGERLLQYWRIRLMLEWNMYGTLSECNHNNIYFKYVCTRNTAPRRADARFGSAHARNDRGRRQIEAVNATALPRGTPLKISRVQVTRNETLGSDSMNQQQILPSGTACKPIKKSTRGITQS